MDAKPQNKPLIQDAFIVILLDAGIIGLVAYITQNALISTKYLVMNIVRIGVVLPLSLLIIKKLWDYNKKQLGFRLPNKAEMISLVKILLISLAGYLLLGFLAIIIAKPKADSLISFSRYMVNQQFSFWFIFAAVVQAPIVEEVIFRGILINSLKSKFSTGKRIVISALIFGFIHLLWNNSVFFPVTQLVGGLIFAWSYERTNSLLPCILLHAFGNGMLYLFYYLNVVNPKMLTAVLNLLL